MSSPTVKVDEFGNKAHGLWYRDYCRFAREYEPLWDAVQTNKAWSVFVKEDR